MNLPPHSRHVPGRKAAWFAIFVSLTVTPAFAEIVVSNVRSAQRVGTKLVDIDYDLASTDPATVALRISDDDGVTFAVPATALSGAFGAGMNAGTDKRITWNAGVDWNGKLSSNMRFEVTASDTPPAPDGFALIPAGSFQMGDQSNPLVGGGYELPVHSVYVSEFYMAKHEMTKELWDEVRAWGLNNGYTDLPVGNASVASKGANHPVHSINRYSTAKWCNARSKKEGLTPCYDVSGATYKTGSHDADCNWTANGYRLPTEAEWEKAARGGLVGQNFPWGNTISHSRANYYAQPDSFAYDVSATSGYHPSYTADGSPYTAPVEGFGPNGYGLYNMSGNVVEWCWDWSNGYATGAQTDPRGGAWGAGRVHRGGSWHGNPNGCRVAIRGNSNPGDAISSSIGFRVARSAVPSTASSGANRMTK